MNMSCPPPSLSLFHTLPYTHVPVPVLEIYYILTSGSPPYFFDFLTNQTLTKYETSSNQSTHPVSFTPFLSNTS